MLFGKEQKINILSLCHQTNADKVLWLFVFMDSLINKEEGIAFFELKLYLELFFYIDISYFKTKY